MSIRPSRFLFISALAFVASTACKRRELELPGPSFPAAEALHDIAARPVEAQANATAGPRIELWALEQPLPSEVGVGPALGDSVGEQALLGLAASDANLVADEQLTCAAHQVAVFAARQNATPIRALLRYMVHRCGVTAPTFGWAVEARATLPGPEEVRALLDRYHFAGSVGVWVAQRGEQWVTVAVAEKQRIEVDPVGMAVNGAQVTISGRIGERQWIMGHVSQGEHGVGACQSLRVEAGSFRLVCPVMRTDAGAFVDVYAAAPGRLLGDLEARIWVSPDGSLSTSFEDPARGRTPTPVTGSLDAEFVSAINEVRGRAGAGPLEVVAAESEVLAAVRPHFRTARLASDGPLIDEIVLGLLAGWEIEEPILAGHFSELEFESVGGSEHLLEAALAQPGLRSVLLDPRASRIAITVDSGAANEVRGGMFTTYTLAEPGPRKSDTQWLRDVVDVSRKTRKLDAISPLVAGSEALADAAKRISSGKVSVTEGLDAALSEIAEQNRGQQIRGQVLFAQDVREVEIPKELMAVGKLQLAVHVELVQPANSPWATLMILLAFST